MSLTAARCCLSGNPEQATREDALGPRPVAEPRQLTTFLANPQIKSTSVLTCWLSHRSASTRERLTDSSSALPARELSVCQIYFMLPWGPYWLFADNRDIIYRDTLCQIGDLGAIARTSQGGVIAMEMEFNLQDYVDVILRHWKVVLIVFVAATVTATLASFVQPSVYEATVTLMEESYEFYDAPRLSSLDRTVVKLYSTLALTEAVEDKVVEALEPSLSPAETVPGTLMSAVTVREDKDNPSVFRISARADDPDKAVQIANTWTEQYLQVISNLEAPWTSELQIVQQNLESAEEALATFRQETGVRLIGNPGGDDAYIIYGVRGVELERKLLLLAEHRQARDNLLLLLERAEEAKEANDGIEDLPLQLLNVPVIVDRGQLSIEFVREQGDLDTLIRSLEAEEEIVSEVIDELIPEVEELQGQLSHDASEFESLTAERDRARGAYTAVTNEVQEAQLFETRTEILSRATRAKSVGPNQKSTIMIGAALGLVGGVLAAFAVQYLPGIRKRA